MDPTKRPTSETFGPASHNELTTTAARLSEPSRFQPVASCGPALQKSSHLLSLTHFLSARIHPLQPHICAAACRCLSLPRRSVFRGRHHVSETCKHGQLMWGHAEYIGRGERTQLVGTCLRLLGGAWRAGSVPPRASQPVSRLVADLPDSSLARNVALCARTKRHKRTNNFCLLYTSPSPRDRG